jgi:Flp pilus assembly protein TadD
VAAGAGHLASSLASERVTARFADPQAWNLLGAVLDAFGEPARAADARNKAYALGLGSRGSG